MAYWDGDRWMTEGTKPPVEDRRARLRDRAATLVMIGGLVVMLVPFAGTMARSRYSGWLEATPDTLQAGDSFDVHGCGYDRGLGNVIVSFTGGSWGSPLDAAGCFTVSNIPALSGDTLPAGTYPVRAMQYVHHKWTETGETTVTVVP